MLQRRLVDAFLIFRRLKADEAFCRVFCRGAQSVTLTGPQAFLSMVARDREEES